MSAAFCIMKFSVLLSSFEDEIRLPICKSPESAITFLFISMFMSFVFSPYALNSSMLSFIFWVMMFRDLLRSPTSSSLFISIPFVISPPAIILASSAIFIIGSIICLVIKRPRIDMNIAITNIKLILPKVSPKNKLILGKM